MTDNITYYSTPVSEYSLADQARLSTYNKLLRQLVHKRTDTLEQYRGCVEDMKAIHRKYQS